MAKRKRLLKISLGILIGVLASQLFTTSTILQTFSCDERKPNAVSLRTNEKENLHAPNSNLLFVGVMTAAKYLDSRALGVYETWGKEVPGKVMFYSSEDSYSDRIPLVALNGVDDSYPPQKKSFMMLKHMYENYVDSYEWFLRADDDVYVRTEKLEELLRSVDSRKPWFIGQTGKGNAEEFGQLALDSDENFCMGGPGVILSRETLKRMAPYVEDCLQHLYTTHEDVELGRCVRRFAGISCTWSYEMQVILYHNQSGEAAFAGDLKQKEVHRAITLHPVKQPQYMRRLHKYVKGLNLQKYQHKSVLLHRDISFSMKELGYRINRIDDSDLVKGLPVFPQKKGQVGYLGDTSLLGIPISLNRYTPHNLKDVLEWELISKTLYSHRDLNPRKRIGSSLKEGLSDVVREIMELINSYSKQRGRVIEYKEILYGYWRLDPLHGVDLILDLLLVYKKYRGHKMTVQVRRHAYIQQTFVGIFVREIGDSTIQNISNHQPATEPLPVHKKIVHQIFSKITENLQPILNFSNNKEKPTINFLLPLSGRYETFARFLKNYVDVCVIGRHNTRLLVVLYRNSDANSDYQRTVSLVNSVKEKHPESDIRIINSDGEEFSRGAALQKAVYSLQNDDLMLFIDVDIVFDEDSIRRVRKNTIRNEKIYFPIVYSLYNPKLLNKTYKHAEYWTFSREIIDEKNGFWRQFGFGIVSLYKSDFLSLGGFDLNIKGWGYEDVTFYENVVKSDLKIVRTVDPGLIHVHHEVECVENLDLGQKNMCLGTKASTLGAFSTLQNFFLRYRDVFR